MATIIKNITKQRSEEKQKCLKLRIPPLHMVSRIMSG
jgi:hypothetical protein